MKIKKIVRFQIIGVLVLIAFIQSTVTQAYSTINVPNIISEKNSYNVDFKKFYYNQLNSIEKTIYDNLINSQEKFLNQEEVTFAIMPYNEENKFDYDYYKNIITRACQAYTYDNPEVEIWFDNYKKAYFHSQGYTYLRLSLKSIEETNNNFNSEDIKQAIIEFEATTSNFANSLSGTETEKLKQIHDWLIKRAVYDYTLALPNTRTAYATIMQGRSICSGFAYAFKYIANLANLDVLYVTGNSYNSKTNTFTPHAWNIVCIDGQYFLVDVTFDNYSNYEPRYNFFLSTIEDEIHFINTNYFNYPF